MSKELNQYHTKSKLDKFNLDFEVNRSFSEERKLTKKRTGDSALQR